MVFVLGPMCGITRTTSEPPCHRECARWSAKYCPFLSRPHMGRRDDEALVAQGAIKGYGMPIERNPGVALLWAARNYRTFKPEGGGRLITVGEPTAWEWWAEGRPATREEVERSIASGLPFLEAEATRQSGGMEELRRRVDEFRRYLPL